MLQTRPSSASGMLQTPSQNQGHHQYPTSSAQMHRNSYHGISSSVGPTTYRGHTSMTPVAPYAFTSTPSLTNFRQPQGPYLRTDQRTASAPVIPTGQTYESGQIGSRSRYPAAASVSTNSSSSSSDLSTTAQKSGSRDDSVIPSQAWAASQAPRPQSAMVISPIQTKLSPPNSTSTKSPPRS